MQEVIVKCPICNEPVEGEINTYLINSKYNPTFIKGYYAHCNKCNYDITESEWDEIPLDKTK